MRDLTTREMLLMYGHVPHENRKQFALSSTNSKLPQVGQNNNIFNNEIEPHKILRFAQYRQRISLHSSNVLCVNVMLFVACVGVYAWWAPSIDLS